MKDKNNDIILQIALTFIDDVDRKKVNTKN